MKTVILSESNYKEIKEALNEIREKVNKIVSPAEHFIGNKEFFKLMEVSPRTAQTWRDEGRIGFSQRGKQIYYRMSDIERFLEANYKPPFAESNQSI